MKTLWYALQQLSAIVPACSTGVFPGANLSDTLCIAWTSSAAIVVRLMRFPIFGAAGNLSCVNELYYTTRKHNSHIYKLLLLHVLGIMVN